MSLVIFTIWWFISALWWVFAFYKIDNSPDWYTQAQIVCFGQNSNGLPEPYGWMLLIGGPALLLTTFFTLWGNDFKEMIMKKNKKALRTLFVITSLTLALSLWVHQQIQAGILQELLGQPDFSDELPDTYPVLNKAIPSFELVDEWGNKVTPDSIKGKVALISFMFAHCQTMCPAIVDQVKFALKKINRNDIPVYFITLDPWRDTPNSLPSMAKKWGNHPQLHFLSGDPKLVSQTIEAFGVPAQRDTKTGDIAHPAMTFVINQEGLIHYALNNASGNQIAEAIKKTLK